MYCTEGGGSNVELQYFNKTVHVYTECCIGHSCHTCHVFNFNFCYIGVHVHVCMTHTHIGLTLPTVQANSGAGVHQRC